MTLSRKLTKPLILNNMKQKLFFAALAALSLVGCKEMEVEPVQSEPELVELTVNLPDLQTKITGSCQETMINDVRVLVFDANGMLESSGSALTSSVSLTCTAGHKTLVALVNVGSSVDVTSLDELKSTKSELIRNSSTNLVMEGQKEVDVTASTTVTINVKRLAARISLKKVELAFDMPQYEDATFNIKSVYLINVPGNKSYLTSGHPTFWYNKMERTDDSLQILYDIVSDGRVSSTDAYTKEHYFYCYPNSVASDSDSTTWSERKTRLVVEAQVNGVLYYYPITLDSVAQNTSYSYNLKITRVGSVSPDIPLTDGAAQITVEIDDWVEMPTVNEII